MRIVVSDRVRVESKIRECDLLQAMVSIYRNRSAMAAVYFSIPWQKLFPPLRFLTLEMFCSPSPPDRIK